MPRKPRLTEPGFYHVINRGVARKDIFYDDEDYATFLNLLLDVKNNYAITIHTFCLMTNHYHILLETKEPNISKAIQYLNDKYAKYFNKKHKRTGHLWQGRFKSFLLYDEAHFWIVSKYIERNPVSAKIVSSIDSYKYQSFYQRIHKDTHLSVIHNSMIFDMNIKQYRDYIDTDLQEDDLSQVYKTPKVKIDGSNITILKKKLEDFFEEDRDINRNENIKKAYAYGYTKAEIAKYMSLSPTAISKKLSQK